MLHFRLTCCPPQASLTGCPAPLLSSDSCPCLLLLSTPLPSTSHTHNPDLTTKFPPPRVSRPSFPPTNIYTRVPISYPPTELSTASIPEPQVVAKPSIQTLLALPLGRRQLPHPLPHQQNPFPKDTPRTPSLCPSKISRPTVCFPSPPTPGCRRRDAAPGSLTLLEGFGDVTAPVTAVVPRDHHSPSSIP